MHYLYLSIVSPLKGNNDLIERCIVVKMLITMCGVSVEKNWSGAEVAALSYFQNSVQNHTFLEPVSVYDVSVNR